MSVPIPHEEAFKKIAGKKRKERTLRIIQIILIFLAIPLVLGLIFWNVKVGAGAASLLLFVVCFAGSCWGLLWLLERLTWRRAYSYKDAWLSNPSHRAYELFKYGFYELALKEYDVCLNHLFEESCKRDEKLLLFFEEYRTLSRFIDGIPRPIPYFDNHDLDVFYVLVDRRSQCLIKLERQKEAEAAIAQLAVIKQIQDEGKNLTKKYWEIELAWEIEYD